MTGIAAEAAPTVLRSESRLQQLPPKSGHMCRFTFYKGTPLILSSLLTEPEHSLIHQSFQAEERDEPLNGDGGWEAVPVNHMVCIEPDLGIRREPVFRATATT